MHELCVKIMPFYPSKKFGHLYLFINASFLGGLTTCIHKFEMNKNTQC